MKKVVPIVILVAVAALLLVGALLKQAWSPASVKGRLQQQGVWIARYLSVSDFELQGALNELKIDRPTEIMDPSIWEQVITNSKEAPPDAIIVVCKQTAGGRQLVIRRNQSVSWIPAVDGP
jgi:ABC-type histidine transport system ATPase subunit